MNKPITDTNKTAEIRQIILKLLEPIVEDVRKNKDANPDLWKLYIDNACYRIEWLYEVNSLTEKDS